MDLPRVLVTGANGYIGRHTTQYLEQKGYPVRQAVRSPEAASRLEGDVVVIGNIQPNTEWTNSLDGVAVVVHTAARVHKFNESTHEDYESYRHTNTDGTLHLAEQAVQHNVKKFIFLSTIAVYDPNTKVPLTENSPINPITPYAQSKWAAEQALSSLKLQVINIRPPMVYGQNAPGNYERLAKLIARKLPLPLGNTKNQRSMLYIDNLSDFIFQILQQPEAQGAYNVCDDTPISTTDLVKAIRSNLGVNTPLFRVPKSLVYAGGKTLGKEDILDKLWGNLILDSTHAKVSLNWNPLYSTADALKIISQRDA